MSDPNPEKVIENLGKKALPLMALSPLAGVVSAALAWCFACLPQAGADLALVFPIAGGVSFCLFLGLALFFKNRLLRGAGRDVMSAVSECSASKISAREAKEILVKVETMLKECEQVERSEKERLEQAMAEITSLLKETDAVVRLTKEKVAKMVEITASVVMHNGNSENALKEDD